VRDGRRLPGAAVSPDLVRQARRRAEQRARLVVLLRQSGSEGTPAAVVSVPQQRGTEQGDGPATAGPGHGGHDRLRPEPGDGSVTAARSGRSGHD